MNRWMVAAMCVVVVCGVVAGDDASPDAAVREPEGPTLDTPVAVVEFLSGLYLPISDADLSRIVPMMRAAHERDPGDHRWAAALALLGRYTSEAGDADAMARTATERAPESALSWYAMGVALSLGDPRKPNPEQAERTRMAIGAIEHALTLDPVQPGALEMAAEYYATAPAGSGGSRERAGALADRMIAIGAIRWRGAELRAKAGIATGDWAVVDEWYGRAVEWAPTEGIARDLRMRHGMQTVLIRRDYERAIAMATPFADPSLPEHDRFSYIIGQAAFRLGDYELARVHYRRVVDAGDPPPPAMLELAESCSRTGDYACAIEVLEQFLVRFRGHPRTSDVRMSLRTLQALARESAPKDGVQPPPPGE